MESAGYDPLHEDSTLELQNRSVWWVQIEKERWGVHPTANFKP
jgi:hypothetical protein